MFEVNDVENVEESKARDESIKRKVLGLLSPRVNQPPQHGSKRPHNHYFASERNSVAPCVLQLQHQFQESVEILKIGQNGEVVFVNS